VRFIILAKIKTDAGIKKCLQKQKKYRIFAENFIINNNFNNIPWGNVRGAIVRAIRRDKTTTPRQGNTI
jgi:hypothetical protein